MEISFIVPTKFDEVYLDRLYKGLASRFRFNDIKVNKKDDVIIIRFTRGSSLIHTNEVDCAISNYVNGFFAAIGH